MKCDCAFGFIGSNCNTANRDQRKNSKNLKAAPEQMSEMSDLGLKEFGKPVRINIVYFYWRNSHDLRKQ